MLLGIYLQTAMLTTEGNRIETVKQVWKRISIVVHLVIVCLDVQKLDEKAKNVKEKIPSAYYVCRVNTSLSRSKP